MVKNSHNSNNLLSILLPVAKLLVFVAVCLIFLIFLPAVFSGKTLLSPIAFSLDNLHVKWYGILIALGAVVAYGFIYTGAKSEKMNTDKIEAAIIWVFFSGLVGARIGFIVQNISYFFQNPLEMVKLYHGGLSIHGALIGGLIALAICSKVMKLPFYKISNVIAPPVLLAIGIGRWGNFFNQEIVGQPTNIWWKMYVSPLYRPDGYANFSYFHPVFLYEFISLTVIFLIYWYFLRKRGIGLVFTLIAYCLVRIIVEFWRIDYRPIWWKLDLAQVVSFAIIVLTVSIFLLARKYARTRTI